MNSIPHIYLYTTKCSININNVKTKSLLKMKLKKIENYIYLSFFLFFFLSHLLSCYFLDFTIL